MTCRKSSGVTKINNSLLFKCPAKWGHCVSEPTCTVLKMKQEMDLNHHYILLKCLPCKSSIALVPWYKNGTFRIWYKVISPYTQCTLILEVQFLLVNQVYAKWSVCVCVPTLACALPLVTSYLLCKCHPPHHEAPLCAGLFIIWSVQKCFFLLLFVWLRNCFFFFILWGMIKSLHLPQSSFISSLLHVATFIIQCASSALCVCCCCCSLQLHNSQSKWTSYVK